MGYDPETKMSSLQSCWISRASAEQRKGRAGRTGPGVCYRLYSTEIHSRLLPYSVPEIQRIPLESVGTRVCLVASAFIVCCFLLDWYIQIILQMIAMSVPNPLEFPFIERPSNDKLEASLFSLQQHQGAKPITFPTHNRIESEISGCASYHKKR
jgi:HrpA-like RNA helicase